MKIAGAVTVLSVVAAVTIGLPVPAQETADSGAPFTLTITGNLIPGHSQYWDFANAGQLHVKAGSTVVVAIRQTNVSDHSVAKLNRIGNSAGYGIEVRDSSGNPVQQLPPKNEGGSFVMHTGKEPDLQPGGSDISIARPSEGLDLSQPGTYIIQAWAHTSIDPQSPIVKSNALTLVIEPATPAPE